MNYQEYINSPQWQQVRTRTLKRDDNKCAKCGREVELDIHHRNYDRLGQEEGEDVITLCRRCHRDEHYYASCIEPSEKMLARQRWATQEEYETAKTATPKQKAEFRSQLAAIVRKQAKGKGQK